jgi:hypothetical protein
MHPPRQHSRHEVKNSADNKKDPFGDFHVRIGSSCDSSFSFIRRALSITVGNNLRGDVVASPTDTPQYGQQ